MFECSTKTDAKENKDFASNYLQPQSKDEL